MTTEAADDFDAAKAIYEKLKDVPQERQEKILRWVCESLGIALPTRYIEKPAPPLPAEDQQHETPSTIQQQPTDIKSFIASKKPKSDTQFAAAVAYYYRFVAKPEERRETINAEQLQDASRQARGGALHLPKATLNNAVASGFLDRAERGAFRVNTVGENLVAMTLPGGGKERAPRRRRGSRKRAPAKKG
jgi:hypothetical protein